MTTTKFYFLAALAICAAAPAPSAHAFEAPSGTYGNSFSFNNRGSSLILVDNDLGAVYSIQLDNSNRDQELAKQFYEPALYAHPQVRMQRSFIRSFSVSNVEQITDSVIRAKLKMDLGFKTIAGDVLAGTESTVVLSYTKCRDYNDYWQPNRSNKCLNLEIQSTRLSSFHSPLGEAMNQAMGMIADIFVQGSSAVSKLKLKYSLEKDNR